MSHIYMDDFRFCLSAVVEGTIYVFELKRIFIKLVMRIRMS